MNAFEPPTRPFVVVGYDDENNPLHTSTHADRLSAEVVAGLLYHHDDSCRHVELSHMTATTRNTLRTWGTALVN